MTTILLARHGETDWNREMRFQGHSDPPLNETGRAQARALAERLAAEKLDAVYSSPLQRARETAEIVAAPHGLPVQVEPGLMEVDVGSWSGLTRAELEEHDREALRSWLDHGPGWTGGETYEQMAERVVHALERIEAEHPDGRVLLVTHGGSLRAVQAHALGISFEDARRSGVPTHNCGLFECVLGSRTFRRLD